MPRLDAVHALIAAGFCAVLAWASVSDVMHRKIPNACVLTVLALYAAWALAGAPLGVTSGLMAAAIGLGVGYGLFVFKIMGAGDAKLFAAAAPFFGLAYLPMFALATVLAGGAMAIVSLAARPRRAMVMLVLRGKGDDGRGIPYGVAISVGAMATLWSSTTGVTLSQLLQAAA
jgi:prepilin peptidase CpaA